MTAEEAIQFIQEAVQEAILKAIKFKLAPGESCPFCGHKRGKRQVSEKMLAANRANIKQAHVARRKNNG